MAAYSQFYIRSIRRHMRMFWRGQINRIEFTNRMIDTVRKGLTKAWDMGMKDVGLDPDEITSPEFDKLYEIIHRQYAYVLDLGDIIYNYRKEIKGRLADAFRKARLDIWANRFDDMRDFGRASGKADPKLKWVMDPAKENCPSCVKLNGKVKRRSFWRAAGVKPRSTWDGILPNPMLVCGGWLCGCRLVPTDEPLTRGRLPRLP